MSKRSGLGAGDRWKAQRDEAASIVSHLDLVQPQTSIPLRGVQDGGGQTETYVPQGLEDGGAHQNGAGTAVNETGVAPRQGDDTVGHSTGIVLPTLQKKTRIRKEQYNAYITRETYDAVDDFLKEEEILKTDFTEYALLLGMQEYRKLNDRTD